MGLFNFAVSLKNLTSGEKHLLPQKTQLAVLFNPYSPRDDVYMDGKIGSNVTYQPDEKMRHEYIENEEGAMWLSRTSNPIGWTFDQFDVDVLLVTLDLLNDVPLIKRGNPVVVSRALSALMNANDEGGKLIQAKYSEQLGLVAGKWAEPYEDGKKPWYWTGSGEIFSIYRYFLAVIGLSFKKDRELRTLGTMLGICRCLSKRFSYNWYPLPPDYKFSISSRRTAISFQYRLL